MPHDVVSVVTVSQVKSMLVMAQAQPLCPYVFKMTLLYKIICDIIKLTHSSELLLPIRVMSAR